MFQVTEKKQKKMTINCLELQINAKGKLNRNDGIVKTGTGAWENKKKKSERKRIKQELKNYAEECYA